MLDIGIVIPELAKYGGAERVAVECLSRWQDRHKITLYATSLNRDLLADFGVHSVRFVELTSHFDGPQAFVLNGTLLPKIWEQQIGRHDVYHGHLWPTNLIDRHPMVWYPHEPPRMLQDLRYCQSIDDTKANAIWRVHCYPKFAYDEVTEALYEASMNTLSCFNKLGQPDRIVANSRFTAARLQDVYNRDDVDVVYPGVRRQTLSPIRPSSQTFLTVSQLWPHKRVNLILEALSLLPAGDLTVVGDGPELPELQRMTASLGIAQRVRFLQSVDEKTLAQLYGDCRGVVFVAYQEPFGIVPLEALSFGRPLISAGAGGYTELVDDSCSLHTVARPADLAEKMQFLLDRIDEASKLGVSGREMVGQYTWEKTADDLLTLIEETHDHWLRQRSDRPAADKQTAGPLFGVQYYCWYGNGAGAPHWNDNPRFGGVTDMPALGYYSSTDGATISEQLRAMADIGLDFAVLNLHVDVAGANPRELAAIHRVFQIARQTDSPLRFAIQLCPYEAGDDEWGDAIRSVRGMADFENYLQIGGMPVLFVFWTGTYDRDHFTISMIREQSEGFVRLASSMRLFDADGEANRTYGLFDGWCLFSPLELASDEDAERLWQRAYDHACLGDASLRIATVSPGYDDHHLTDEARVGNPHRIIERHEGKTYQKMIDFVAKQPERPDLVLVSTFNEYHENTHIEASRGNGTRYMDMTRDFIRSARSASRGGAVDGPSTQKRSR